MQLRNDYDKNVFNGDVGLVATSIRTKARMTVRFDERDVAYEEADLDELVLAYACTSPQEPGQRVPGRRHPAPHQHFVMLSENLLYTAVTRGKRLVVLVTDPRALELALWRETRRGTAASRGAPSPGGGRASRPGWPNGSVVVDVLRPHGHL